MCLYIVEKISDVTYRTTVDDCQLLLRLSLEFLFVSTVWVEIDYYIIPVLLLRCEKFVALQHQQLNYTETNNTHVWS